jgi:hypothetical protein
MSVEAKALVDVSTSYTDAQAGDLLFVERGGVAGRQTRQQLQDAMQAAFGISTQTSPIRLRLGNLQILAGVTVTDVTGNVFLTFPTAFTAPPILSVTPVAFSASDATFQTLSASGALVQTWESRTGAPAGSIGVHWLAIGPY